MAEERNINWLDIEAAYRLGVQSLRAIAKDHGVSDTAIRKKAAELDWERDLTALVRAKADAEVAQSLLTEQEIQQARETLETHVVEANAAMQARVRLEHRQDIARTRKLFQDLMTKVETSPDDDSKRVDNGKKLTDMLEKVVRMEREATGIDKAEDSGKGESPLHTRLQEARKRAGISS